LVKEAHAAEGDSFLEQDQKSIIHLSKNSVFRVREREYFFQFHIQSPKATMLATVIYFERSA
jgi:hypothetical protein